MFSDIKQRLEASIEHLSDTVSASLDAIAKKFGEDSYYTKRLENYISGIEHQKILVQELATALETENYSEVSRLALLINSISFMIKDDARLLLEEMHTGSTCEIPEDMIN